MATSQGSYALTGGNRLRLPGVDQVECVARVAPHRPGIKPLADQAVSQLVEFAGGQSGKNAEASQLVEGIDGLIDLPRGRDRWRQEPIERPLSQREDDEPGGGPHRRRPGDSL